MEPRPDLKRAGAVTPSYVAGLDLGQSTDFTALSVAEIRPAVALPPMPPDADPDDEIETVPTFSLAIRHMERFPLHTPYPVQVASVGQRVARLKEMGRTVLVVDHTGVGRAVVDMFRTAGLGVVIWPVTIATSAMTAAKRDKETGDWTVPKKDVIGALVASAHDGRLAVSDRLPDAAVFKEELRNFRMKITADANLTYGAWREGAHDDLVLSVALACWAAARWAAPGGLM